MCDITSTKSDRNYLKKTAAIIAIPTAKIEYRVIPRLLEFSKIFQTKIEYFFSFVKF